MISKKGFIKPLQSRKSIINYCHETKSSINKLFTGLSDKTGTNSFKQWQKNPRVLILFKTLF